MVFDNLYEIQVANKNIRSHFLPFTFTIPDIIFYTLAEFKL